MLPLQLAVLPSSLPFVFVLSKDEERLLALKEAEAASSPSKSSLSQELEIL